MFTRLRTTWLAAAGAMALVLALTGSVLGASLLSEQTGTSQDEVAIPLVGDTVATFEDLDGNGVDDACQTNVVANPEAAALADAAADLDGDGTISVAEAAQSGRTGGKNCNHGGYVSSVAQETCEAAAPTATTPEGEPGETGSETTAEVVEPADCDEAETAAEEVGEAPTECVEVPAPVFDPATMNGPGAFGAYVASVAQSDAVGGKNCNHGGAVSEAVKAAKAAATAERAAAKAERAAERAAAKAERDAAKAERQAAKANAGKSNGKGGGQGQ